MDMQHHHHYPNTKLLVIFFLLQAFSRPSRGRLMLTPHSELTSVAGEGHGGDATSAALGLSRALWRTTSGGKGATIGIIRAAADSPHDLSFAAGGEGWGTAAVPAAPCADLAVYPAVENAISDGVDAVDAVFMAEGASPGKDFRRDEVAKAAFRATKAGILPVCPAGDLGKYGLANAAPWILTVGASTTGRVLRVSLRLGGGEELHGESLSPPVRFPPASLPPLPLLHLGTCNRTSAYGVDITEKVVLCDYDPTLFPSEQGRNVSRASAVVVMNSRRQGAAPVFLYPHSGPPTVLVGRDDARRLVGYASSSPSPVIAITPGEVITGAWPHPSVWASSSRGPSPVSNGVLKPDVVGPGVDIETGLSASTVAGAPSGTSLASSHLAGVAALLRRSHPDWSPAAIKSAIMTSSDVADPSGNWIADGETGAPASVFAMGAGHVNAEKADDPGLVYDAQPQEYIPYLCGLGYTDEEVSQVTATAGVSCDAAGEITGEELNYPSISVALDSSTAAGQAKTIRRRVTNVGPAGVVYMSRVDLSPEVQVVVYPHSLYFKDEGEVLGFSVTFAAGNMSAGGHYEGQLWWESLPGGGRGKRYTVRSPLSVTVRRTNP